MGQNALTSGLPTERANTVLLGRFLTEQQQLTAVEKFEQQHAAGAFPLKAKFYRDLIPLESEQPKSGQQYAFEVNLDACSGCKSCVTACHSMNGLDPNEVWRSVGLLVGGTPELPMLQMVTASCHHCAHPACMNGCPVLAYEKNPFTGIVKHLDDQCIGCQYCVLMCPYDVPKYNPSRGIVRKCDMCSSRLEAHEAPACVQGCPTSAIRITIVDTAEAQARAENDQFLPASPDPRHTVPTTRYIRSQPFPNETRAANAAIVRPADRHTPLVFMLVLTQLSVGLFFTGLMDRIFHAGAVALESSRTSSLLALSAAAFGLNIALLHLGKPLYAFRAVLGLKRSWMSREIVVFGLFGVFATAFTFVCGGAADTSGAAKILEWLTVLAGFSGVFCSAMIYVDTQRECWAFARTAPLFVLTTLSLGVSGGMVIAALKGGTGGAWIGVLCRATIGAACVKLALELSVLRHRAAGPMARTALLLTTQLGRALALRVLAGLAGGLVLPILMLQTHDPGAQTQELALLSFVLLIAGELLERMLFFQSAATAAMPGALTT